MSGFEKFKEELPSKVKKLVEKEYKHALKVWDRLEMKTMKNYHNFYFKCDVLLLADVLETVS